MPAAEWPVVPNRVIFRPSCWAVLASSSTVTVCGAVSAAPPFRPETESILTVNARAPSSTSLSGKGMYTGQDDAAARDVPAGMTTVWVMGV